MTLSIRLDGVRKSFGDHLVLSDITLDIEQGEIFGLLGPSGAGKTTLIRIITGQLKADQGKISVMGVDPRHFDGKMYTNFGMVLDNTGLYERLSCYDNLALFAEIYGTDKQRIMDYLGMVGLQDAVKTPAGKLSKGMKQRLTLARALLHDPQILFLDEPTSGLDPSSSREIHKLIQEECRRNKTVFLTTHNMMEAYELCEHVALLNEGHIVEYGKPDEICRKYNRQNQISIMTRGGRQLVFANGPKDARQISSLLEADNIRSIHSSEPTLETVFIELTGRGFDGQ
ncbi:MAG: ABC transporter ATP-binding protein [Bilifractor sp.]|jgi:ABC-2 type transport system ATP-binding protein